MNFTMGSDPELMLTTKDGQYFNAAGIVQGDVENRINIRGHQFYFDNVMAECAIKPGNTRNEVIENIHECLAIYADMVKPFKLTIQASQEYSDEQIQIWPSWMSQNTGDLPPGLRVGCSPDWCAYEMQMKKAPIALIQNSNLRSCGGHIHLGAEVLRDGGPNSIRAIYMLDIFLGIPSLWLDTDPTSVRRRGLYGQAGRYRVTDYGIEYRSLGNFWLASPRLVGLIYDLCEFTLDFIESGKAAKCWEFNEEVFYSSDNPADAWKCQWYDPKAIRQLIDCGEEKFLDYAYFKLEIDLWVKSLIPKKLWADIKKTTGSSRNLYANWKL